MATPIPNPVMAISMAMIQAAINAAPGNVRFSDIFAATSPPGPTLAQIKAAADLAAVAVGGVTTGPPAAPTGISVSPGLTRASAILALRNQGIPGA